MKRKNALGSTKPSFFTFTFIEAGSYVFNDAESEAKIMIITVMGAGETCSDPDRYVQTLSGDTLAELGVA